LLINDSSRMTTIESDQKAQPLRAAIQSSIGAKPQISSKTSKSIRREKNTDRDKENTTNSNVNAGNDETQNQRLHLLQTNESIYYHVLPLTPRLLFFHLVVREVPRTKLYVVLKIK